MSTIGATPKKNFGVHRGAPAPIRIRLRGGGVLVSFDNSLKFTVTHPTGSFTLGVGTGITLSAAEAVSNAEATIQLSVAQSRQLPLGALSTYEIQRTAGGQEQVFLMGKLIAEGGGNPDD
ncbi:MAG: hypothetical protein IOC86_13010 [Aestuariivirga sp.]|nr:hypothetical protein [Aestuariivirga sp.]